MTPGLQSSNAGTGDGNLIRLIPQLDDEVGEWLGKNQELVLRFLDSYKTAYLFSLNEDELWNIIAENASDPWKQAKDQLSAAEALWNDNRPLGSIGAALETKEMGDIKDQYFVSLAHFHDIDEGLRVREDLKNILLVLQGLKRLIQQSTDNTQRAKAATSALQAQFEQAAEEPQKKRIDLAGGFERVARALRRAKDTKDALAPATTTAPAPSSPGT